MTSATETAITDAQLQEAFSAFGRKRGWNARQLARERSRLEAYYSGWNLKHYLRTGEHRPRSLLMRLPLFLSIVALALASGCGRGTVDAVAINGVMNPVLDRHDAYVAADPDLSELEREAFLRSSLLVREMVSAAVVGAGE